MAKSVGKITVVDGDVYIQDESGMIRKARVGVDILAGDLVKAFDNSTTEIKLDSGKFLTISEGKEILIDESVYSEEEFAEEDVDADTEELFADGEINEDDLETAAGEEMASSGLKPMTQKVETLSDMDSKSSSLSSTSLTSNSIDYNSMTQQVDLPVMESGIVFPDAPTIVIGAFTNTSGSNVDVTITFSNNTHVGDTLTITNPNGTQSQVTITQDMLDNGYVRSYPAPKEGTQLNFQATITDDSGYMSDNVTQGIMIDTTFGDTFDATPSIDMKPAGEDGTIDIMGTIGSSANSISSLVIMDKNGNTLEIPVDQIQINKDGTFSINDIDVTSLANGKLNITAIAIDGDGNTADMHIEKNKFIDTEAPEAPTITIVEDTNQDHVLNARESDGEVDSIITFGKGTEVGDLLTITYPQGSKLVVEVTQDMLDNGYETSFEVPAEGTNAIIRATVTDANENESLSGSNNVNIQLEFDDASIAIVSENGDNVVNSHEINNVSIEGKVGIGSVVNALSLSNGTQELIIDVKNITILEDGTFTIENIDLSSFTDGILTTTAEITDKDLNQATLTSTVEIDTSYGDSTDGNQKVTPPSIDIVDEDNDGIINSQELTSSYIVGTIGEGGATLDKLVITDNESEIILSTKDIEIAKDGTYRLDNLNVSNFADGDITITAYSTDRDGNTTTVTNTITLDTLAPVVTIMQDENNDGVLNATELKSDIDVKIIMGKGATVGDILTIHNPDGSETEIKVTQDIIENGYIKTYDAPAEGKSMSVSASVEDSEGKISTSTSSVDSIEVDTKYGDDINNDGDITPVSISFVDANGDEVVNATEAKTMKISGSVGEGGATLDSLVISDGVISVNVDVVDVTIEVDGSYNIRNVDISNLSDSDLSIQVNSTDRDGNTTSTSSTIRLDTKYGNDLDGDGNIDKASTQIQDADGNGIVNLKELQSSTLSGNVGEAGLKVESVSISDNFNVIEIPKDIIDGIVVNDDGSYSLENIDLSKLIDGTLTISTTTSDIDGNTIVNTDTISKDSILNVSIDNVDLTGDTTPRFNGNIDGDATSVIVTIGDESHEVIMDLEHGKWTLKWPTTLSHGEHEVSVTAQDAAGNVATIKEIGGITIDSKIDATIDTISDDSNISGDFITNDNSPVIRGSIDGDVDTLEVRVDGKVYKLEDPELSIRDGEWKLDLSNKTLPDKEYTVTAEYIDNAKNASQITQIVTIDTNETVNIDTFNDGDVVNDRYINFSGSTENAVEVKLTLLYKGEVAKDGDKIIMENQVANIDEYGNWNFYLENKLGKNSDTTEYTLKVIAVDAAGNTSEDNAEGVDEHLVTFTVDATDEKAITVTLDETDIFTNTKNPIFSGTVTGATDHVEVKLEDSDGNEFNADAVIDYVNNTWNVAFSADIDYSVAYTVTVTGVNGTDKAEQSVEGTLFAQDPDDSSVSVDITQIDGKDVSDENATNNQTSEIRGTASDDAVRVVLSIDGATFEAQVDTQTHTWVANIPSDVSISDAKYDIEVTAFNKYQNSATDSESFTLDTKAPTVTIDDMPQTNDQSPTISGTFSGETSKVILTIGSQTFEAVLDQDNHTWSLEWPNNLAEGGYRVYAEGYDSLGNGVREHNEFVIDNVSTANASSLDVETAFHATRGNPTIGGNYNNISKIVVKLNGIEIDNSDDNNTNGITFKDGKWSWEPTESHYLMNGEYNLDVIGIKDSKETIYAHKSFIVDNDARYNDADKGATNLQVPEGETLYNEAHINTKGFSIISIANENNGDNAAIVNGREFTTNLGGTVILNADGTFVYTAPVISHNGEDNVKDYFSFKESDGKTTSDWQKFYIDVSDKVSDAQDDAREVGYKDGDTEGVVGGNLIANDSNIKDEMPSIISVSFNGTEHALESNSSVDIDGDYGTLHVDQNGDFSYTATAEMPIVETAVGSETSNKDDDSDTFGIDGYDITLKGFKDETSYLKTDDDGNLIKDDDGNVILDLAKESDAKENEKDDYAGVDSDDSSQWGSDTTDVINNVAADNEEGMVIDFKERRINFTMTLNDLDKDEIANVRLYDENGKLVKEVQVDGADDTDVSVSIDGVFYRYASVNAIDGTDDNGQTVKSEFGIKTISFTPMPTEVDQFSYTIKDSDSGDESSANITFKYTFDKAAIADVAFVDESGLANGTHTDSALVTATGNLLENDNGLVNNKISEVDGVKFVDGTVTIENDKGILVVHENGDYTFILTHATTYMVDDNIEFSYKLDNGLSSKLNISVADDTFAPTHFQEVSIHSTSTQDIYNVTLVIDKSGSLSLGSGSLDYFGMSQMDITKDAINNIIDKYSQMGKLNVNIVDFSDSVSSSGWILDNDNNAKDYINFIEPNGGSNYANALEEVMATSSNAPDTKHNILYFLADGTPSEDGEISESLQARWNEFRDATFSDVNAISFGENSNATHDLMGAIAGEKGNNIAVTSALDLSAALSYGINDETSITGDLDAPGSMFNFGADGGYIKSIEVDGTTYTYEKGNDSIENETPIKTFTTKLGGIFSINCETGEYSYQANLAQNQADEHEIFNLVAVDSDGDTATSTLKLDLNTFANLDTNDDIIITNKTEGFLDIPAWSLLSNDNQGYDLRIDEFNKAKYMDIEFDKENATFTVEGYDDYVNPFSSDGKVGQVNLTTGNTFDEAVSLERGEFGQLSSSDSSTIKDASMPTIRVEGELDNTYSEHFVKVQLLKGEWLVLDVDNGYDINEGNDGAGDSLDTDLTLYDADGNVIAMNEESKVVSGGDGSNYRYDPYLSFMAKEDGEYYVKVSSNAHDNEGQYTLMASIVPAFDKMSFEYSTLDGLGRDSNSIANFMRTASHILSGSDQSEVFISNDEDTTIDAQGGDDAIVGGDRVDNVDGGAGNDTIKTGKGNDIIDGGDDNDIIEAGEGDDTIAGGKGHDTIDGGTGSDTIIAGRGSDTIVYDTEDALVDGGADNDTILVNEDIDFSNIHNLKNIETIDLQDGKSENITLDVDSIIDMSDNSNTITIYGDDKQEDSLTIKNGDGEWSYSGQEVDKDNTILNVYEQDGATIKIDEDIKLDFE